MKALSSSAASWWSEVWDRAPELYKRWLAASPQGKLAIKAVGEDDIPRYDDTRYVRVEQAAISLLPNALPTWLQTELISNRQLDSTAIIFRVLTEFSTWRVDGALECVDQSSTR